MSDNGSAAPAPWRRRMGGGRPGGFSLRPLVWGLAGLGAVVALLVVATSCTRQVHPGNVGVRVNNIGTGG